MTNPARSHAPSAALRRLCLAGIALSPAVAAANPLDLLRSGPPPELRCTPVPPTDVITIGAPMTEPLPGPANDLVLDAYGQQWVFGDDGGAWYRTPYAPWTPQDIGATADLNAAVQGHILWVVGDGGAVWSRDHAGAWRQHDLPGLGKPDLVHVASQGNTAAVASADGALLATLDGGETWERLAGARDGAITALHLSSNTVTAARADGRLLVSEHAADGSGGWAWTSTTRALPPGPPIREVLTYAQDAFLAVDASGTLWNKPKAGTWQAVRGQRPIRALTQTTLGLTAVHTDGTASVIEIRIAEEPTLRPIGTYATHGGAPEVPPGIAVRTIASNEQLGLLALTEDGQIFYQTITHHIEGGHPCGRPFEIAQEAVCAPAAPGAGWTGGAVLPPAALPADAREALAAAWLQDAQAEHASVASFARFALRLLALGAPAALVADAQAAMGDEIRHAERCYALASRYAGATLRPGPLPIGGALDGGEDLAAVSVEVLRESAIGESIGALLAETMRQQAADPHVREALAEIAADEARHAQAAWRFLAWAVAEGGEPVRAALEGAFEEAVAAHLPSPARGSGAEAVPAGWAAHGRLTGAAQRRVIRRAIRQVARPCMAALVRAPGAPGGPRYR